MRAKRAQKHCKMTNSLLKDVKITDATLKFYKSPQKPNMQLQHIILKIISLKVLVHQRVILESSEEMDFQFLHDVINKDDTSEYSEYNVRTTRDHSQSKKPATKVVYTPLINRKPSDSTTMLSAMIEAQRLTIVAGQKITIFTADQQLYKVMVDIT